MISIIVAVTTNGAIGKNNDLLYYIADDLKRFKMLTTGHTVVMGRRTFESLPKGALPNRQNIVLSHNKSLVVPGALVVNTVEDAISNANDEIFVIGGKSIYEAFMKRADRLRLTEIDAVRLDADTFFPTINPEIWERTEESEWKTDEKSGLRFRYVDYRRKVNKQ